MREGITIVVPIYNAFEVTLACLDSVVRHTAGAYRLLLLDDASSDPRMWPALCRAAAEHPQVEALRNPRNLGYTATINRGCELAGGDDVVLLNSDAEVSPGWLDKLRATAASRLRVATVTPLSNAAGAFSVPRRHRVNPLPPGMSVEEMARLVEACSERLYPEVPTGNGFCLLVRRRALDEVGLFDAAAFPRGVGEENDFCMRARARGFVHLIDDATFVFHHRSASLTWRKRWLLLRARWYLRRRYPSYERLVAAWLADDPVDGLRRRLLRELERRAAP